MTLKQSEREFQAQLMQVVEMLGGMVYHTYDSRRSPKGYPDLTIIRADSGDMIWAELKVGKKQPTSTRSGYWLRALPDHQAYLWRPEDWDDAVRIIQEGHRVSAGRIPDADGLIGQLFKIGDAQFLPIMQHEPTCIACRTS